MGEWVGKVAKGIWRWGGGVEGVFVSEEGVLGFGCRDIFGKGGLGLG